MPIFSKPIDKGIPPVERHQIVSSTEVSTGDIVDVRACLGGSPASEVHFVTSAGSDLTVRYNVIRKIYPNRQSSDGFGTPADLPYKQLAGEIQVIDQSMGAMQIPADNKGEHEESGPITSIEVNWSSGTWELHLFG